MRGCQQASVFFHSRKKNRFYHRKKQEWIFLENCDLHVINFYRFRRRGKERTKRKNTIPLIHSLRRVVFGDEAINHHFVMVLNYIVC